VQTGGDAASVNSPHGGASVTQRKKKHSKDEISAKLAQASELAGQGKLQSEIAAVLGVSVMTLHRWRKAFTRPVQVRLPDETGQFESELGAKSVFAVSSSLQFGSSGGIADLQLENSRLRRLVTDLLLEKMKVAEEMQANMLPNGAMKRSVS
jgi:putative transposase